MNVDTSMDIIYRYFELKSFFEYPMTFCVKIPYMK